jgi:hypothetical protein
MSESKVVKRLRWGAKILTIFLAYIEDI